MELINLEDIRRKDEISPEQCLEEAKDQGYENLIVIGYKDQGTKMGFSTDGTLTNSEILWLIENFRQSLLFGRD